MNNSIRKHITAVRSKDPQEQNAAFLALMKATEQRVDWAYEAWDELLAMLTDKDNHVRAIGAQVLCNLAISDPKGRMLKDFGEAAAGDTRRALRHGAAHIPGHLEGGTGGREAAEDAAGRAGKAIQGVRPREKHYLDPLRHQREPGQPVRRGEG